MGDHIVGRFDLALQRGLAAAEAGIDVEEGTFGELALQRIGLGAEARDQRAFGLQLLDQQHDRHRPQLAVLGHPMGGLPPPDTQGQIPIGDRRIGIDADDISDLADGLLLLDPRLVEGDGVVDVLLRQLRSVLLTPLGSIARSRCTGAPALPDCCTTWASSWASSERPSLVPGRYSPAAKAMSRPWV